MDDGRTEYVVETRFEGESELRRAANEMNRLGDAARRATAQEDAPIQRSSMRWTELASGVALASGAMYTAVGAGRQIYATLREGAALQTTTQRFEKLSESIGTTADALRNDLRESTRGMIDDATLMASASQLMSLGLADNHEQVVRLATVSGQLGWDMQQVILTFANLSTMRLDALGLSVDEVREKQKALEAQGLSTAEAFKEAVIQAGEARLGVQGVSESEQSFKQAEAAVINYKNALLESVVVTLEQAGAFEALSNAAAELSGFASFTSDLERMLQAGEITKEQYNELNFIIRRGGEEAAQAALQHMQMRDALSATGDEVPANQAAWAQWALATSANLQMTQDELREIAGLAPLVTDVVLGEVARMIAASADAEKLLSAGYMRGGRARQQSLDYMSSGYGGLPYVGDRGGDRYQSGALTRARMDYDDAADAARGYGSALSYVDEQQQLAAEGAARMVSTFRSEIVDINQFMKDGALDAERYTAALNEGLINAEGQVNVEAMNQALYAQTEAAGASAATLALLGVATGQFTEEQAEAALKAAVLQEQIRAIAEAVTAGDLTIGQGLEALNQARENIDAGNIPLTTNAEGAMQDVEGVRTAIEEMVDADWVTVLDLDYTAVDAGVTDAQRRLNSLPDQQTITLKWQHIGGEWMGALAAIGAVSGGS